MNRSSQKLTSEGTCRKHRRFLHNLWNSRIHTLGVTARLRHVLNSSLGTWSCHKRHDIPTASSQVEQPIRSRRGKSQRRHLLRHVLINLLEYGRAAHDHPLTTTVSPCPTPITSSWMKWPYNTEIASGKSGFEPSSDSEHRRRTFRDPYRFQFGRDQIFPAEQVQSGCGIYNTFSFLWFRP